MAGNLFGLPGLVSILALSILHASYQDVGVVEALFFGLKLAVLAILVQTVIKVGSRALKNRVMVGLAAATFIAIFLFQAPFPLIIITTAIVSYLDGRVWSDTF